MKIVNTIKVLAIVVILFLQFILIPVPKVAAATTPGLGQAESFSILSGTYTNTVGGTTLNGDLGYTTGPATAPTVNGTTYSPPSTKYSSGGTDQGSALVALNAQTCDFTFGSPTDLSLLSQPLAPGVYCVTGATSIGTGGITLNGAGTYIFRVTGALTSVANSVVTLSGGASACNVFWTPSSATTLGANSTFIGTDIDASGITIGSTVLWTGRALAFGGTVSTNTDTLSVPNCAPTPTPTATPTATPGTSSSSNSSSNSSSGTTNVGPCIASPITTVPLIIEFQRVSPTSVSLSWGPYAGLDTFNVQYGMTNGNWLYNTNVTGFSTTLNDLPANTPIWVQVAARNNCAIGSYSEPKFIGGPRLPNTGFGPDQESTWNVNFDHFVFPFKASDR